MGRPIDEDEAINAILREYNKDDSDFPTDYQLGLSAAKKIIEQLSPAQPVHNTGKWVRGTSHGLGVYNWTCKCGHVIVAKIPDRFCGACGCDNAERRTDE